MTANPAFTVLIASYAGDDPDHLRQALDSIFRNSLQPEEVLLVIDGPLPATNWDTVRSFCAHAHLRLLVEETNRGLCPALNRGLREAKTDWIVRADADDINAPDRFWVLLRGMTDEFDLVGSAVSEIDSEGRLVARRAPPLSGSEIRRFMRRRNPFNHMSVIFRRALALTCGGYPDVYLREDYGLWAKMAQAGARMRNIPDNLVTARAGTDLYVRRSGWKYAVGEIHLQRLLVKAGIKSVPEAVWDGSVRMLVFLAPLPIRRHIYESYLRD